MNTLVFTEQFEKAFSKIPKELKQQIWKKVQQLEERAPLGKKLKGNPYWSIHINRYRVVYLFEGTEVTIIDVLERKHDYKEL